MTASVEGVGKLVAVPDRIFEERHGSIKMPECIRLGQSGAQQAIPAKYFTVRCHTDSMAIDNGKGVSEVPFRIANSVGSPAEAREHCEREHLRGVLLVLALELTWSLADRNELGQSRRRVGKFERFMRLVNSEIIAALEVQL